MVNLPLAARWPDRGPYVPQFFEHGALPGDRAPDLHELQILENERWARMRARRVEAHRKRVAAELRELTGERRQHRYSAGKPRAVFCVELDREFESVKAAATFVQRAPTNIIQAIRFNVRCGGYHWVRVNRLEVHTPTPPSTNECAAMPVAQASQSNADDPAVGLSAVREVSREQWLHFADALRDEDQNDGAPSTPMESPNAYCPTHSPTEAA